MRHLTDYLEKHAQDLPGKLALVTPERSLNWGELWAEVQLGAAYLDERLDSQVQQVVALLMPNTWQNVVAYLSILHAGHMAMPVDVIFKPLEIEAVLRQVPPTLIITDETNRARLPKDVAPIIDVEELTKTDSESNRKYLRLPPVEQVASLFFTSGTTGKPKVVPNTHANHVWNIMTCSKVWNWTADDSQLVNVRLSHMLGLVMGLSGALYHGGTIYLQDKFNAEDTLKLLASGKVTMFSHGPQVFAKLLEVSNRANYDLSKVRLFICGSGPLPPPVWQEFKKVYGVEILEVYGTSETGRIASNLLEERIAGSPGRPLPGVKLKLSESKEVLVKSPGIFPGYFNNRGATRKAKTPDGYWRTGDLGELINGRLVLKGRRQERIRKQGYTISPRDVEWALHKDKRIKEILVMGVQQAGDANDKLIYFLVGDIGEAEVRKFCAANLPSIWRPDQIVILDVLPRTRTGKPELAKLKAMIK